MSLANVPSALRCLVQFCVCSCCVRICAAAGAAGPVVTHERADTAELCEHRCHLTSKADAQQDGWTGGCGVLALHVSCSVLCSSKPGITTLLLCQGECAQSVCFVGFP